MRVISVRTIGRMRFATAEWRDDFCKLVTFWLCNQVNKQPAAVNVVPLRPPGEFRLDFHHFHRAVCIYQHIVRRIPCSRQHNPTIFLLRQQRKGNVRRCLDDPARFNSRYHHGHVILVLSPALESSPDFPGRFCRIRQRLLRRGTLSPCAPCNLGFCLRPVARRQVFQFHSGAHHCPFLLKIT